MYLNSRPDQKSTDRWKIAKLKIDIRLTVFQRSFSWHSKVTTAAIQSEGARHRPFPQQKLHSLHRISDTSSGSSPDSEIEKKCYMQCTEQLSRVPDESNGGQGLGQTVLPTETNSSQVHSFDGDGYRLPTHLAGVGLNFINSNFRPTRAKFAGRLEQIFFPSSSLTALDTAAVTGWYRSNTRIWIHLEGNITGYSDDVPECPICRKIIESDIAL